MASAADLLASIEAAIQTFLANGGIAEYQLADGTKVRRESLGALMAQRAALREEAEMDTNGAATRLGLSRGQM